MAEALGLAASIIAVVQLSDQVISLARRYITDFKDAPRELHAIHIEVSTLKAVFDSLYLSGGLNGASIPRVPGLEDAVAACEVAVQGLEQLLVSGQNTPRLQWTWKASKARALLEKLLQCKITVNVALSASTSNKILGLQRQLDGLNKSQINEHERSILEWLSPLSYDAEQDEFFDRWQKGTCRSLLDSQEFQKWNDTISADHVLFCPGMQGAGKTIFSSVVVDHLLTVSSPSVAKIGVAYLYCNFKRRHEQRTSDLLSNVLKQLVTGLGKLPDYVKSLYTSHSFRGSRPPVTRLLEAIRSVIAEYSRVVLVVDALDELAHDTLESFLPRVVQLSKSSQLRLFTTSRPIPDITKMFIHSKALNLEVRPTDDDMRMYIRANLPPQFTQGKIVDEIEEKLLKVANGMFLLVHLHLNQLKSQKNTRRLQRALDALEVGSNRCKKAYDDTMRRIETQDEAGRELAEQVIWWIACSKQRLTAVELQHAIAIFDGETCFEVSNLTNVSDMVSVCAGLVTVDESTNVIRLVHHTAQEYLDEIRRDNGSTSLTAQRMELSWACICMKHLLFDRFKTGPCAFDTEVSERLAEYPLLQYVATYWGHHYRELEDEISLRELVMRFLESQGHLEASVQIASLPGHREEGYGQEYPRGTHPLWVSARFNLQKTCDCLLDKGHPINKPIRDGSTALHEAARNNSLSVMDLLLKRGAAILKNSYGVTAVHEAARCGHSDIIGLLIGRGIDVDILTNSNRTPLHDASSNGHLDTISLLLSQGVNINAQSKPSKWTPLHGAVSSGNVEAVQQLLDSRADISSKTSDGESPLHIATLANKLNLCCLLLDHGADGVDQDCQGDTPAHIAARGGFNDILNHLAEKGISVETPNLSGATALHVACSQGREESVLQLIGFGVDVNCITFAGACPIHLAAEKGRLQVVQVLLRNGADIDAVYKSRYFQTRGPNGKWNSTMLDTPQAFVTALYLAETGGWSETASFLLEQGARVFSVDESLGRGLHQRFPVKTFHNPAEKAMVLQRLQMELNEWLKDPLQGFTWGPENQDNLLEYVATICGPESTPYSGGLFVIRLTYPTDYPFKPPKARMSTRIFHPNINSYGSICLDILQDQWSPALTTPKLLLSIQSLIDCPDPDNPLVREIGDLYNDDRREYMRRACATTKEYAL